MTIFNFESKAPSLPQDNKFWLAETACIIGNVNLDLNTSVWFGAVIRGDNEQISIGYGTNVQENCIIHTDEGYPVRIGRNCTIGHGAIIHGCSIGDNCIIGMGAIILNGAEIGKNCMVGAGTLVTEKKRFLETGKLILGAPARCIRDLKEEEIKKIRLSAKSYQIKAQAFKKIS